MGASRYRWGTFLRPPTRKPDGTLHGQATIFQCIFWLLVTVALCVSLCDEVTDRVLSRQGLENVETPFDCHEQGMVIAHFPL